MTPLPADRIEEHVAAFRRGAVDLIDEKDLRRKLAASSEGVLRVKFGMDPSSPDLHLGHAIQLFKLRDLQELGHTIVLIVGDATAMVGDPSGRNKLRPQLTREEVRANMRTYTDQAARILDLDRAEVRYNFEWFGEMGFEDVLRLAGRMTVAQMVERDTFQKRMAKSEPVGIHELLYPLMQGWDSVVIDADVEIGATDQLFNILVGRQLQEQEGRDPQVVLTHPLIDGLDGRKMSKSYGNAVGLTDPPGDMFGKIMSLGDDAMGVWFLHLTRLPEDEIAAVLAGHPREAKARLATEITAFFHGAAAAGEARDAFDRQFRDKELPADIPELPWPGEEGALPLRNLVAGVFGISTSEAGRLVKQRAVRLDGEVAEDPQREVAAPGEPLLVQAGKRRFARVTRRD